MATAQDTATIRDALEVFRAKCEDGNNPGLGPCAVDALNSLLERTKGIAR
mgnify:CR=1 FL=1